MKHFRACVTSIYTRVQAVVVKYVVFTAVNFIRRDSVCIVTLIVRLYSLNFQGLMHLLCH
jgi:hypothetical protein